VIATTDNVQIVKDILSFLTPLLSVVVLLLYKKLQIDVNKIERATNSMKDALVAKTDEAAHARGMSDQRAATAPQKL